MKQNSRTQIRMKGTIQIIISAGKIGLLNIDKGQFLELPLKEAKLLGLGDEVRLAKLMEKK